MDRNGCRHRSRNPAAREMDTLVQRDASDDEFEPVWARLDAYDIRYDDGFNEVYPAILADIHKHPTDWQFKGPLTHSDRSGKRDSGCRPAGSCSQLRSHPARHVEAGPLPFFEGSIPVERLSRDRNHAEVARKRTESHNDGGPDPAAAEICEWDRQQDDIIS
jgi:hypothetical protein